MDNVSSYNAVGHFNVPSQFQSNQRCARAYYRVKFVDAKSSLGVSWLPDWGSHGAEQGAKKPQRTSRPGTPRPSTVELLQSKNMDTKGAKENCNLEGETRKPKVQYL